MTIKVAYKKLLFQLYALYQEREAANIADMVIEHISGFRKLDRVLNSHSIISIDQEKKLETITQQLLLNIPVQYVLKEAWFYGMKFFVDKNVLIPRPETEELIEWMISEIKNENLQILDIGTGSGCIAIAVKKKVSLATITALDISETAIKIAKQNATILNSEINFIASNFLNELDWNEFPIFDIIVSNPPYIKQSEKINMNKRVTEQEPHAALFVPDDDALLFYKKIAVFGKEHLSRNGKIFVEINEILGTETESVFRQYGYQTQLKKDLQGKERMIMAIKI